jgi:hypothetical protein
MWHKDSRGNWYMAENEDPGVCGNTSLKSGGFSGGEAASVDAFNLGTGSSIYLFSSIARGA